MRSVGVGWRELADEIEALRVKTGARCVLAQSYGVTGWLSFYLPKGTCVVQRFERIRWINGPQPGADQLGGKLLYVDDGSDNWPRAARYFNRVDRAGMMVRKRGPLTVDTFEIDCGGGPQTRCARANAGGAAAVVQVGDAQDETVQLALES